LRLLILKRANTSRLSGQLSDDYDVLENGVVVDRICKVPVALESRPWMWASGHNGDQRVAPGYEATQGLRCGIAKSSRGMKTRAPRDNRERA
jgi:hypothetical protein